MNLGYSFTLSAKLDWCTTQSAGAQRPQWRKCKHKNGVSHAFLSLLKCSVVVLCLISRNHLMHDAATFVATHRSFNFGFMAYRFSTFESSSMPESAMISSDIWGKCRCNTPLITWRTCVDSAGLNCLSLLNWVYPTDIPLKSNRHRLIETGESIQLPELILSYWCKCVL